MKTLGRSIELFFHDGGPDGITTATIPFQWTGHVLVSDPIRIDDALKEPEAARPGIYLLVGKKNGADTLYVGETDKIRRRIKQHLTESDTEKKKDWWERAILVTATGAPLNKAHSRYLESRVYKLANQIGEIATDQNDPTQGQLSKAATAHMEDFLSNLRLVLAALGFDFLTEHTEHIVTGSKPEGVPFFVLKTKEVLARAWKDGGKFIVEAGSLARKEWTNSRTKDSTYGRKYEELVQQGVIADVEGHRKFTDNYAFSSVSAAASVVTGRPTSGPGAWVLENNPEVSFGAYQAGLTNQQV